MKDTPELPLVALIGPTNAGKSTLFNRLTGTPQAITAREESTTRDRVYGEVDWQGQGFTVVDTGGLVDDKSELYQSIKEQMLVAVKEADLVLFIYDGRIGLQPRDQQFMDTLRAKKKIWLIANKIDAESVEKGLKNFDYLGLPFHKTSAATGRGVGDLLEQICQTLPYPASSKRPVEPRKNTSPIIAIVGRPNVGKSTLLNHLTGAKRSVVSPLAGTTRDIVTADLNLNGQKVILADTAGVRRKGKINVGVEQFSVKRTLAAITHADLVLVVTDAEEGTTRSDLHLIYFANSLNNPVLVIFNKADLIGDRPITFHHHIAKFDHVITSAKTGENIAKIRQWIIDKTVTKV